MQRARIAGLVAAAHPEPVIAVTLLVGTLAWTAGRGPSSVLLAVAVGLGHLGIGWSNDYLDRDLDRSEGRTAKPLVAGTLSPRLVGGAAIASLVIHLPLALLAGVYGAAALFVAEAGALAYNLWLKDLPVSVVVYALSFGLLPGVVTLGSTPPHFPAGWSIAAAALLGIAGHLTQVLGDLPSDRRRGSRGFPQLIGRRASIAGAVLALLAAAATVVAGAHLLPAIAIPLLGLELTGAIGVVVAARGGRTRLAFQLTIVLAAFVVVALVVAGRRIVA